MTRLPGNVGLLFERLQARGDGPTIFWRGREVGATDLLRQSEAWSARLAAAGVRAGTVCGYMGDYSPGTTALFLALMRLRATAVPFTKAVASELPDLAEISGLEVLVE